MDAETVDQSYAQLQQQAQQTTQLIQTLAGKLQAASTAGDPNAREWLLDLKEITLGMQQGNGQTALLLQAIHAMIDNHVQATTTPAPQQQYQQAPYQQAPAMGGLASMTGGSGGGMLQRFLGGGMGRAIMTGAGFGIGDDLINQIF
jgi:Tfp pilus assembly protein PilN